MADINWLGSIGLGIINRFEMKKSSTITPISFPGKDADRTEGVDTLGIISYMNISGRKTGTFEELQTFIYQIRLILDGQQIAGTYLTTPFINGKLYSSGASTTRKGSIGTNTSTSASKLIDSTANWSSWGVQSGLDLVKNMTTGLIAQVDSVDSDTQLTLNNYLGYGSDLFTATGTTYAVTASFYVKVLNADFRWELPGLSWVDYSMSFMQVEN